MEPVVDILRVCAIQWHNALGNKGENLAHLEEELQVCKGKVDLIVLPELFNTGYTEDAVKHAEPLNLTSHKWMQQMAARLKSVVMGSIAFLEDGKVYNACLIVYPQGNTLVYKKRHLFSMNWEKSYFTPGQENLRFQVKGWTIAPYICYDLRFPEWCRNTMPYYDLAVFPAAWPRVRLDAWNTLLAARAIENQAYVIGVNQLALNHPDGELPGGSGIYSYAGLPIKEIGRQEGLLNAELSLMELNKFRQKLPFLADQ